MTIKVIILLVLIVEAIVSEDVIRVPKKFTRSRYSHRKTTAPTTELPASINDDNSVDMVTDVFSEDLLPNKIEDFATNDPFIANDTTTTVTPLLEIILANSTDVDILEETTEVELEVKGVFDCGEKIDENHPWIAVLVHTDPSGKSRKKTLSKGVLIDQRHAVTTVSSLHNSRPFWVVSEVRLGGTPVWGGEDVVVNKSSVVHIGIEEIFHRRNKDIALIKLAENVNLTNYIRPICLSENDQNNFTELFLHVCKKPNQHSTSRNYVVSNVSASPLSLQDCTIMFHRKKALLTSEEFCAWDEAGDSCTGDLGGPLIGLNNGRYHVIGLNSHINSKVKIPNSLHDQKLQFFQLVKFNYEDYPGIYVRVASHLSWIKKITSLNN